MISEAKHLDAPQRDGDTILERQARLVDELAPVAAGEEGKHGYGLQ